MHHPANTCRELRFLPAMFSFSGPTTLPEFDFAPPSSSAPTQTTAISSNWETRCLRKHRRREYDEGCSAKKRRLMMETEVETPKNKSPSLHHDWPPANNDPPLCALQAMSLLAPQPCSLQSHAALPLASSSSSPSLPETESSCMEVEAAQRRLQEIEDRITLEDDDEDLDVEPTPRRPVLVMSDSLKEGLQRGITDILPHTVAQSVSHSCMELVLWRPPDDPFCRRLKGSLQKQRKQQMVSQQHPTPCPSPTPPSISPPRPPSDSDPAQSVFPVAHTSGEEDMEM
ncbi:coiled-coil domain-containing protein 117 [Gouania willdenowi]|uniref:Coiled-coil domain-containing protein 117 n=1 Tax=Gouania willdenowi TaxID=441366 RepID=A0A8C5EGS7_GOUWI|nr:coiled-coil domain-containing protein 117 [Gouania willdenowi]